MELIKIIPLKYSFSRRKPYIRAINNLAYNEHTNAYFKCNKLLKLSDRYKLQVSNYIFQVLHSNIDEEIKSSLLINNQIHSHNTRTNNQMSILRVNRSKPKHCVLHNGMITWNSLPDIFKVSVSFSILRARYEIFIWRNIWKYRCWAPLWLHFFLTCLQLRFFKCNCFWF